MTAEQVEVTFAKFDKAGNGKLNYREFCGMMNARKQKKSGSTGSPVAPDSPAPASPTAEGAAAAAAPSPSSSSLSSATTKRPLHSPSVRRRQR